MIAEDYVYEGSGGPTLHEPRGSRDHIAALRERIDDIGVQIHGHVTERSRVVSRWTGRRHDAATGRQILWTGVTVSEVADGRSTRDWEFWDRFEIAEQLASGVAQCWLIGVISRRTMEELPIE